MPFKDMLLKISKKKLPGFQNNSAVMNTLGSLDSLVMKIPGS
jgi:hypothetical protein